MPQAVSRTERLIRDGPGLRRSLLPFLAVAAVGSAAFWLLSAPKYVPDAALAGLSGDATRGAHLFSLGGCASCHAAPEAKGPEKFVLSGGRAFVSPFGTFYAPNISPDRQHGIGGWSVAAFTSAMRYGTTPDGSHYYPAFPYPSYARASLANLVDLKAYMDTLPVSETANQAHVIPFPFNIRRSLGGWKWLFLRPGWIIDTPNMSDEAKQGRALVEGLGHCAECHTPRGRLGNLLTDQWLQGAANPSGKGRIPALTPDKLDWSQQDIAEYLKSGFTPDFDTAGGEMVDVVENTSQLSDEDRAAIAAYLKALPTP